MWMRELTVVGLATTVSARELRRQFAPYGTRLTDTSSSVIVNYTTGAVSVSSTTSSSPSESVAPAVSSLVAAPPYSADQSSLSTYGSSTASIYAADSLSDSATTPTTYSNQKYSFNPSPVGPGTAPSGYFAPSRSSSPPPSGITGPPTYAPTSTASLLHTTSIVLNDGTNASCHGETLNVLNASLDWWYTKTLYYAISTFFVQFDGNETATGWTLLPASTPFNVSSALAAPDCTSTQTFVSDLSRTIDNSFCTPAALPVAADTTIITQTAFKDPPSTTGNGTLPDDLVVTPPPASISVADATQAPYTQGTPFVFFSQYEIVTKSITILGNGRAGCAEVTQAYKMDQAFSFEYLDGNVNGSLAVNEGVTGDVNPALLGLVGADTAVAGSWVAEPTVVLLLQEVFAAAAQLAATVEPTASQLDTPTPTKPPFITLAPTDSSGPSKITYKSPHVESSQTALDVPTHGNGVDNRPTGAVGQNQGGERPDNGDDSGPQRLTSLVAFIANIAHTDVTLNVPAAPTQNVITTQLGGQTVTATRLSALQGNDGPGDGVNGDGGVGGLVGAINTLAKPKPTNAFEVLSEAAATFRDSNPTANAIINGIGGDTGGRGSSLEDATGGAGADIPLITFGNAAITPNAATEYSIAPGATLTPGGSVVVDGTTISLDSAATKIVVDGQTRNLVSPAQATGDSATASGSNSESGFDGDASGAQSTLPPILTIDGHTFHAINGGTTYVINGETLTPGEEETITIDGTTYDVSLAPSATRLIVGTENGSGQVTASSTQTLFPEQGSGSGSGASETGSASGPGSGSGSNGAETQVGNTASTDSALPWSGACFAVGSLFLAIWL